MFTFTFMIIISDSLSVVRIKIGADRDKFVDLKSRTKMSHEG